MDRFDLYRFLIEYPKYGFLDRIDPPSFDPIQAWLDTDCILERHSTIDRVKLVEEFRIYAIGHDDFLIVYKKSWTYPPLFTFLHEFEFDYDLDNIVYNLDEYVDRYDYKV